MSTKSKRAGTATPQPRKESSTPVMQQGSSSPGSPLSPTRTTRMQEKTELRNLNDRLACYIDRVRNLETENSRLSIEVQTTRDTISRETTNIKSMYETELNDARRLLDETARDKAKLEIDTKRLWVENDELKQKLDKKTKDCSIAEGNARMYETRLTDLTAKLNLANADRKKAVDELNEFKKEVEHLRKQFEEARKNLEDETLSRVDLENHIQSLREELTFKDQIHLQEITETRSRRQVDITEIDGRLSEQYEAKLQRSLQELREQYEGQMRANREDIEALYDSKIKNLQAAANRNSHVTSDTIEELRTTRTRVDALNNRITELENVNSLLNGRIRELEQLLDRERQRHSIDIANLEGELQRMRDEMAVHLQEYQDLMDIKVSLDIELAAYDKLLCGEETRLNITPNPSNSPSSSLFTQTMRSTRSTPARRTPSRASNASGPFKRKRTVIDESEESSHAEYFVTGNARGDVKISDVDASGKFIKLQNTGTKEVAIGGWQLVRRVGANETIFKFHRSAKIEPNGVITVWSSEVGVAHEPPANIVMKTQRWFVGESMKTIVINNDGEEMASTEHVKRTLTTHSSRGRTMGGRVSVSVVDGVGTEDLYHHQGEPQEQQGQERCRLM